MLLKGYEEIFFRAAIFLMKFLVKTGKMTLLCIYQHPLPLKNTTPSFLSSPPLLNLETVRAPFLGHPPCILAFRETPSPP